MNCESILTITDFFDSLRLSPRQNCRGLSLSKNYKNAQVSGIIKETGVFSWKTGEEDARREPIIVDLDALVPKDHLLRKIEKVMDYEWLYERLAPYYCHDNGRPGTDPDELTSEILSIFSTRP